MNKQKLEAFAVNARKQLGKDIKDRLWLLGITESGIQEPVKVTEDSSEFYNVGTEEPYKLDGREAKLREELVKTLQSKEETFRLSEKLSEDEAYEKAFESFVEEAAFTWFNRLIALRFLEVNDYLPGGVRVLSSRDGRREPEIVVSHSLIDGLPDRERLKRLGEETDTGKVYKTLFEAVERRLSFTFPFMFKENSDYTDLLFPFSYTSREGVLSTLIREIPEEDFDVSLGGVEIIGWLYEFYNSEMKDRTYEGFKKRKKVTKETLPFVTQIFTPDWIVKYMVENSLGRLWINHLRAEDKTLSEEAVAKKFGWKYYVPEGEQTEEVKEKLERLRETYKDLSPESITFLDPAMGSGHILSYAFDVLMQIYRSQGYLERDAARLILKNNLFGLDIDRRASQLAEFSLLMKAGSYSRRLFKEPVDLNLYEIPESNSKDFEAVESLNEPESVKNSLKSLLEDFSNAKLTGSLIRPKGYDYVSLIDAVNKLKENSYLAEEKEKLERIIKVAKILSCEFDVVVTNPPYMGSVHMDSYLKAYLKKNYPEGSRDFFAAFILRNLLFTKKNGYLSMIVPSSIVSVKSFEQLRKVLLKSSSIQSFLHMGNGNFGHDFGSAAFVLRKGNISDFRGDYFRLHERTFQYIFTKHIETLFLKALNNPDQKFDFSKYKVDQFAESDLNDKSVGKIIRFSESQESYSQIPGAPIAYWASEKLIFAFKNGVSLETLANCKVGLQTGNNNQFLREWFEVGFDSIKFDAQSLDEAEQSELKWFPLNKGGNYRKWYGNNDYVVNWENNGFEIRNFKDQNGKLRSVIRNEKFYFKPSMSWSDVSSGQASFRYKPQGSIFDTAAPSLFADKYLYYLGGLCNSPVVNSVLEITSPTIHFTVGAITRIPVIIDESKIDKVESLVKENISLAREDWDAFEISWDFKRHPLVRGTGTIEEAYRQWEEEAAARFEKLKSNEEELNRIFIGLYGLDAELTPDVEDKFVSVRKADRLREIKSLLSFAIGCIFGRYSLDEEGLILAGGKPDESRYRSFKPDRDGIIPILEEAYFFDDVMDLFISWLKTAYGERNLEENLDFIASTLGGRGEQTSRERIRSYFLKEFVSDHNKIYSKRPIYWLYDSGRNNGFKALIYMHRYDRDSTGRVAADYLRQTIEAYTVQIDRLTKDIDELEAHGTGSKREAGKIKRQIESLRKKLNEARTYSEKVRHLANLRIGIDLDDGVLINHRKVQTDENGNELTVLSKI